MTVAIAGLATAVPPHVIDQKAALQLAMERSGGDDRASDFLPRVYERSGVEQRAATVETIDQSGIRTPEASSARGPTTSERMLIYARQAPRLAEEAARSALVDAGVPPQHITHLLTVSCTGLQAPGLDVTLINALKLDREVHRLNVGFMGCHGAFNALRMARAIVLSEPKASVLVVSAELCSIHYRYDFRPDAAIANAIFADGASAFIVQKKLAPDDSALELACGGSCVLVESLEEMTWQIGDHGFEMTLSARVPNMIRQQVGPWLNRWLGHHGVAREDVASWAIHPGGPRILAAVREGAGLGRDSTRVSEDILREHGNMSSATLGFILERILKLEGARPIVALGFGPGLVVEGLLLR